MAIDADDARKAARLARIRVSDEELPKIASELASILVLMESLREVDVEGVDPMSSVTPMRLEKRPDKAGSGIGRNRVLSNAPDAREGFFAVPKVVE